MIEASESQESDNFQLVTINGETIIDLADLSVLSGTEKLQVLTLGEAQEQGWGLEFAPDTGEEHYEPVIVNPPIIEEENSSDNLPAIGHLEGFEIQTADDGTLLPCTVNAKMADGSYQRLTLFPQVVDGNVTCMVHFENEVAQVEEQPPTPVSLSEKIDSIICQNEDIIAGSKMTRVVKKPRETPISVLKPSKLRQAGIPLARRVSPLTTSMSRNSPLYFPVKEALDPGHQFIKLKEKLNKLTKTNDRFHKFGTGPPLQRPIRRPSLLKSNNSSKAPVNGRCHVKPLPPPAQLPPQTPPPSPPPQPSVTTTLDTLQDSKKVFIKTNPEFFKDKEKNDYPLGSIENPITLLQAGQVYHSQQPLSETQLRQISSILKSKRNETGEEYDSVVDPQTNSRIMYRVVYPEEKDDKPEEPKQKRAVKRGRSKAVVGPTVEPTDSPAVPSSETLDPKESTAEPKLGKDASPAADPKQNNSPKVIKSARTRSGRLSRPPRYMVQDYKRLQTSSEVPAKATEAELYVDYRNPDEEAAMANIPQIESNPSLYLSLRAKRKKNFKPEYRCPSCQKIYLGHGKMMLHLRKFPDHSNINEYLRICERARTERKIRPLNLNKLKQLLSGVDKNEYGPLLANAFTLWDFLLLRVNLFNKQGIEEFEALLKELHNFLEKLGEIAEELLSPVFDQGVDNNSDVNYVHVDKLELAYALGLPQGTYKVNTNRLHLLRLPQEEPPPPPPPPPPAPKPSQLATKFEPNLSTKLMECSNDSIDLDCSSKDIEPEDEKKEWTTTDKVDQSNSEFLSEFLQNQLPDGAAESLAESLWKTNSEVAHVSPAHALPVTSDNPLSLWKGGKVATPSGEELPLWKDSDDSSWKNRENQCTQNGPGLWKRADPNSDTIDWRGDVQESETDIWKKHGADWRKENEVEKVWKNATELNSRNNSHSAKRENWKDKSDVPESREVWQKNESNIEAWQPGSSGKETKKDWHRQWKVDAGAPGMRTTRLTSTPETQAAHGPSALFSPPLRRNSVSSFATTNQEEFLGLDLHELFDDLMPEQNKPRRPKPGSIESIINEAIFTGNEPPQPHASLPPLIPDSLDEVTNLDFLNQD